MVFSIPSFATVGDNYVKKKVIDHRNLKTFVTSPAKWGAQPDALFDHTTKSLHEGDKYVESTVADRRYHNEKVKKNLTSNGFKFSSPSQKGVGLGSYFGTIQKTAWRHETDFIVPRKGEAPPKPVAKPRQIYTRPAKQGHFGFAHTTISDIGTDYVASFYDQARANATKERLEHQKLIKGAPFKTVGRKGTTFDEGLATGASRCYMLTAPLAPRKEKAVAAPKKPEAPWRPSGPVFKTTKMDYREDPYDHFDPRQGTKKKAAHASDKAAFKPSSGTDNFWYSTSIAFKRL